ncbi:hypothetical protein EG831_12525, partial [bacterium]|nr:hypothetical protein [bacterium]
MTWIQARAFSSVVGMLLFTATLMGLWLPVLNPLAARARSAPIAASTSGVFDSAEMELLTQELRKQKETLNAREKDLQQLAERLQSERNELYALTQAVARAQSDFDRRLVRIREQETT